MAVHSNAVTVLLTRPRPASEEFAADLRNCDVVIAPLMEIVATETKGSLDEVSGLILTSGNALPFLPARHGLPAFCIGPRTTEAARAAGFEAQNAGANAETLVENLIRNRPHGPLLHAHGVHTRGDVAERLTAAGISVRGCAVYDQRALPPSPDLLKALAAPYLVVPVFSPRSARLLTEAAPDMPDTARFVTISAAAAHALPDGWQGRTETVDHPNGTDMQRAVQRIIDGSALRRISP